MRGSKPIFNLIGYSIKTQKKKRKNIKNMLTNYREDIKLKNDNKIPFYLKFNGTDFIILFDSREEKLVCSKSYPLQRRCYRGCLRAS